jgi:alkylmercury lyase
MSRTPPSLDELRAAWSTRDSINVEGVGRVVIGLLADGAPVTSRAVASSTGISIEEVTALIDTARAIGVEVEDGAVIGAALTLNPTQHRFRVRGNDLYTWCGFDSLFLPIVLSERAQVTSTCPVTGTEIRLTVEDDGAVSSHVPATVLVSIVGPDIISCSSKTGPASDDCTQMPLLASHQAGDCWLAEHPGTAVLGLDDARVIASAYAATF